MNERPHPSNLAAAVVASLAMAGIAPEARAASCFSSPAWTLEAVSRVCVTTSRSQWEQVVGSLTAISFDPGDPPATAILAGGLPPTGDVPLALIPEVLVDSIASTDYDATETRAAVPVGQQLSAGAMTEIFQSVPENPGGSPPPLSTPSVLDWSTDPTNGFLSLSVEVGAHVDIDFDQAGAMPRAWAADLSAISAPQRVGILAVLSETGQATVSQELTSGSGLSDGFIGIVTAEGSELARLRLVLLGGQQENFHVDQMQYSFAAVPEPNSLFLLACGLVYLGAFRGRLPIPANLATRMLGRP